MRVFVAINLPDRTRSNLARSAEQLKQFATKGNFVPTQNYHVTLHFLGEVAPSDLIYVQSAMDGIKNMPAPKLSITQICSMRTHNVVCARLNNSKPLLALHEQLGKNLEQHGFAVEHRAYRPHVTIARNGAFSMPFSEVTKNVQVFNMPFDGAEVTLFASELSASGATYTELYKVTLPVEE